MSGTSSLTTFWVQCPNYYAMLPPCLTKLPLHMHIQVKNVTSFLGMWCAHLFVIHVFQFFLHIQNQLLPAMDKEIIIIINAKK